MNLVVTDVSVAGPHEPLVRPTSFTALPGEVTVVTGDPGSPMVALALALAGRTELLSGSVRLWGISDRAYLQAHVALVDVEDVTAPEDGLPSAAVLREQLALSGQPSSRSAVRSLVLAEGIEDPRKRWDLLPAATRIDVQVTLATRRPGTQVIVLAGPDRHGGSATEWYASAARAAAELFTVVVLCTRESASHLEVPSSTMGEAR